MAERPQFKVVTLCGSMRFASEMLNLASKLTGLGFIVLMPHALKSDYSEEIQFELDRMHRQKIDMADLVIVVTDQSGYIGESTKSEIEYSYAIEKTVVMWRYSLFEESGEGI